MSQTCVDYDYDNDEEELGWEEFNCGMMVDGRTGAVSCELAGTEDCVFDCPYREDYEVLKK